ncbi:TM1812 family CRISPR-associated protein [Saprospira sp. CCB-QB6]|uniref:TM1812 family CRISPR-associated protein n=1 Tax=Saprospira sp. CCB-QB6 TaxID=3023936 RepID=UPI00234B3B2E|nr:TM1812 family CRISPR-associated protein [Saprospira sp. CCB-QB6]WCL81791.1 TM1812 family CRISPR-associated protein [Saprospira sp. CCB-QB6]
MNQKKKVFISFLGTNGYGETKYYFPNQDVDTVKSTPFVQEAIFKQWPFPEDKWDAQIDEVVIFTTLAGPCCINRNLLISNNFQLDSIKLI